MQFTSQSDQKCRPLDLVREKTDKIKSSLDNFRLMFKGYNKMRSSMLPKGVTMLMASNDQDEDDDGPFKRGGIRAGLRNSHRRGSCPNDIEKEFYNVDKDQEYTSLPPIPISFDQNDIDDDVKYENCAELTDKKKESRLRSNSLFEFLGKKDANKVEVNQSQQRHSFPGCIDETSSSSKPKQKTFKFIPKADKRRTKRIPKGTFTSAETGAILPSVLLTYQASATNLHGGCNVLNEYDFYFQNNQMEPIKA